MVEYVKRVLVIGGFGDLEQTPNGELLARFRRSQCRSLPKQNNNHELKRSGEEVIGVDIP